MKMNEAQNVGYKRSKDYLPAVLTSPGESPFTFNGQPLDEIKSPSGSKITYKFFSEKGTEYIMSEKNECRRIKSKQSFGDDGLHKWKDIVLFVPDQGSLEPIDTMFDSAIRQAFRNRIPIIISLEKDVLFLYALIQNKWIKVFSLMQIIKNDSTLTMNSTAPIQLTGVSKIPKVGYHVCEFGHGSDGKKITSYHPGHKVSYIEPRTKSKGKYVVIYSLNNGEQLHLTPGYYPQYMKDKFKKAFGDELRYLNEKQICPLIFKNGVWSIRPNSSAVNALYLNGTMQTDEFQIRPGDEISVGSKTNANSKKVMRMRVIQTN